MKDLDTFEKWFNSLLLINTNRGEFGLEYPLGSCCYRDLLRDRNVKASLRDTWERIIINGQGGEE